MDIFSFILGVLYTFPLTVAVVCVGIAIFFFSPWTKKYRNNLMKLTANDNGINSINEENDLLSSSTDKSVVTENKMKELTINKLSILNLNETNFNNNVNFNGENIVRDLFGNPVPEQTTLFDNDTPNLARTSKKNPSLTAKTSNNKNIVTQPNKIWVQVRYINNPSKPYYYFLGDIKDLKIGDKVIVYTRGDYWRDVATVTYISDGIKPPPPTIQSSYLLKKRGEFLASKNGNQYHQFRCKRMKKVTNDTAIWFENEAQAESMGYAKCSECIDKKKNKSKRKP